MKKKKWYSLWVRQMVLAYSVMVLCRLIFLATHWNFFSVNHFTEIMKAFGYGVLFDTSAMMYFLGVSWLILSLPLNVNLNRWQYVLNKYFFLTGLFFLVLLNLIDVGYFGISGKRSGFEIVYLQNSKNGSPLAYITDYWHLVIFLFIIIGVSYFLLPRKVYIEPYLPTKKWLMLPVVAVCIFMGGRASLRLKPLNAIDAASFTHPSLVPLVINTPFQFLMTLSHPAIKEFHFFSEAEANKLAKAYKLGEKKHQRNVVLIIVESLGKEYVGGYNQGKGYTPFIDSLMQHNQVYTHAYANGKRSIEGIPAIVAGIPALIPTDYIGSVYQANRLNSTGYYLKQEGYEVSFYHGGKNGTMNFDGFIATTQAGKYFGLNEYPHTNKDYDGNWGIPDEPYLHYFCEELNKKQEPFFSTIFTLSSHHPYKIPDAVANLFKGGPLPIHASVEYADYALKCFFENASKQPWFSHTDFIITADHSSQNVYPKYLTAAGKYEIPLIVYPKPQNDSNSYNTIDQMGIMNLILKNRISNTFFNLSSNAAIQFENGLFQMIKYPWVLHFNGEKTVGLYHLSKDSLMTRNLIKSTLNAPDLKTLNQLEIQLKATLQQFTNRLVNNNMY